MLFPNLAIRFEIQKNKTHLDLLFIAYMTEYDFIVSSNIFKVLLY